MAERGTRLNHRATLMNNFLNKRNIVIILIALWGLKTESSKAHQPLGQKQTFVCSSAEIQPDPEPIIVKVTFAQLYHQSTRLSVFAI